MSDFALSFQMIIVELPVQFIVLFSGVFFVVGLATTFMRNLL